MLFVGLKCCRNFDQYEPFIDKVEDQMLIAKQFLVLTCSL